MQGEPLVVTSAGFATLYEKVRIEASPPVPPELRRSSRGKPRPPEFARRVWGGYGARPDERRGPIPEYPATISRSQATPFRRSRSYPVAQGYQIQELSDHLSIPASFHSWPVAGRPSGPSVAGDLKLMRAPRGLDAASELPTGFAVGGEAVARALRRGSECLLDRQSKNAVHAAYERTAFEAHAGHSEQAIYEKLAQVRVGRVVDRVADDVDHVGPSPRNTRRR
jgi:hypothetical protein